MLLRHLILLGLGAVPLVGCAGPQAAPASTPARLRRAAHAGNVQEIRRLSEALAPTDVPAILTMLDEMAARPPAEIVSSRDRTPRAREIRDATRLESDWMTPCLVLAGRHGDAAAARSIVALLAGGGQEVGWIWHPAAQAVVDIAARVALEPADLGPLMTSSDADIAALGRRLDALLFARSPEIPADPETFVGSCRWTIDGFVAKTGAPDLAAVAAARGFGPGRWPEFLADSRARVRPLEKAGAPSADIAEALLQVAALGELERLDASTAARAYVDQLASPALGTSSCAEAGLWRLTGRHVPLAETGAVRETGGALMVVPIAVARWRSWLQDPSAAPPQPPGAEELARVDRLVELALPWPGKAPEPTGSLIEELLASDDTKLHAAIVRALVDRSLADADVERLIAASEAPRSPAHALAARQALFHAGTTAARGHLQRRLTAPGAETEATMLVESVLTIRVGDVPLPAALYARSSPELCRAIVDLVRFPVNWPRMEKDALEPLVAVLLEHPASDEDLIAALDFGLQRHGASSSLAARVLDETRTRAEPDLRARLARLRVLRGAEPGLDAVLGSEASEAEALAAIDAYRRSLPVALSQEDGSDGAHRIAASALRRSAESSAFPSVRRASEDLLADLRRSAVRGLIASSTSWTRSMREQAARQQGAQATTTLRHLDEETTPSALAKNMDDLERTFGPVPDRAAAIRELEDAVARARAGQGE